VVDNKDPEKRGRVILWIPDIMPLIKDDTGLWARPGNNPLGGRNLEEVEEQHYQGSSYIPKIGAWTFVFFEAGNINRPYYFGALDIENTTVLPENKLGTNYEDKWTIFKSHMGRCIVISDDSGAKKSKVDLGDERVEITGKKRLITEPPSGDEASVYTIVGNQTTILFDERKGKEKILIKTYKGDYLHIDIDEQQLQAFFEKDINIRTNGNLSLQVEGDMEIKVAGDIKETGLSNIHVNAGSKLNNQAGSNMSFKASAMIASDCAMKMDQSGMAEEAESSNPTNPEGGRNT
jgi:hypothetical protein